MGLLLALTAAVGWGAADYYGGDATRRATSVFAVVAVSELIGAALLIPAIAATGMPAVDPRLLVAPALAGVAVTVELSLIYHALSRGQAFITTPVGALGAAAAVAVGLLTGGPLPPAVTVGLACALAGGGLSAWTSPTGPQRSAAGARSLALAVSAAAAVATMLALLHAAGRLDPLVATVTEHASTALSAAAAAVIATRNRGGLRPPRLPAGDRIRAAGGPGARPPGAASRDRPTGLKPDLSHLPVLGLVAAAGVAGDLAYVSASRHGALAIVAAVSSLYPLTTIALAGVRDGRRPSRLQAIGVGLALLGAVMLGAAGG